MKTPHEIIQRLKPDQLRYFAERVIEMLYLDDAIEPGKLNWNIHRQWDSSTASDVADCIPKQIRESIEAHTQTEEG